MTFFRNFRLTALVFGLMILVTATAADAARKPKAKFMIKFATLAPEGSTWMKSMHQMDDEVRARTDNRVGFKFYPGGVQGDEKDVFTIRFHLRQRTLFYETYVMPAPEENHAAFFEHLLRRNAGLYGAAFAIGEEDAVFLQGQLDDTLIGDDELDRVLGSLYVWVEQFFQPALRIGFASRFA